MQYSTVQYSTVQHSTAQYSTAQYSIAQHSTAQHTTAQHSTAQYVCGTRVRPHPAPFFCDEVHTVASELWRRSALPSAQQAA
eukprot:6285732-Heterocapsa_arctica.AAC.1